MLVGGGVVELDLFLSKPDTAKKTTNKKTKNDTIFRVSLSLRVKNREILCRGVTCGNLVAGRGIEENPVGENRD